MKRGVRYIFVAGAIFSIGAVAHAQTPSSPNFQNSDSATVPAVFSAASSNFKVDASIEALVGNAVSANFGIISGVPLTGPTPVVPPPPPPPPPGGGGGGGGGGTPPPAPTTTPPVVPPPGAYKIPNPTLEYRQYTFKSIQTIKGTRPKEATKIEVNGSTNGVTLFDSLQWKRDLPLFLGLNTIYVQAKDDGKGASDVITGTIERILIGDVNRSRLVDDIDLSLFTRAWKTYTFFADFNEDGVIDDADLSLLASHWNASY
ncbi:MAG: dockerin type I domain-containing protein [Patescibacteria group bacterium]